MTLERPDPIVMGRLGVAAASLFVDLDGTLAEIRERPSDVRPDSERTWLLLDACDQMAGRVAVISGRPIAEVDLILERACISVAGLHGLEWRSPLGEYNAWSAHPAISEAADVFSAFAAAQPGLEVERKGQSVALHYRRAPQAEEAVLDLAQRLADASGLDLQPGAMVAELRTPGADKGSAVLSFQRDVPFRGSLPIYIGDDLTDEAAFRAVAAQGGVGILVGAARRSAAKALIETPEGVRRWLRAGLDDGAFDLNGLQWLD